MVIDAPDTFPYAESRLDCGCLRSREHATSS